MLFKHKINWKGIIMEENENEKVEVNETVEPTVEANVEPNVEMAASPCGTSPSAAGYHACHWK